MTMNPIYTSSLKFREKVPKKCPEIYWELRKLGARPHQARWKSLAIFKYREGQELSSGSIYEEMRALGLDPIQALKMEIVFWALYDEKQPLSSWEAGMLLHTENGSKIDYVTSMFLGK
jgi:hypothetical protein